MKTRIYEFHDECWDTHYLLVWPVDHATLCAFLKKRFPDEDLRDVCDDEDTFKGYCVVCGNYHVIALSQWSGLIDDMVTLSHECNHAAIYTLTTRGVEITEEQQEPLAYLQGSLFRRCLTRLRRKG